MRKSSRLVFVSLILLIVTSVAYSGEYSPAFPEYLADHQNDVMISAIITMADQVNLRALQDELYASRADRREWHEAVVRALQEKATYTQADIIARLDQMAAAGTVGKYKNLWVGNVIIVSATREALDELVARSDVARISPDYYIEEIEPVSKGGDEPVIAGHEIGLERIHADQCWAMGITGDGRLVSHLDTGVDGNHPALNARWRGYDSRYVNNPEWAWFDPVTNTNFPFDSGQHGTHTMGTMCGLGVNTGDTVGVAFGAEWMSAGVIDRVSIPRTVQDALAAFQWITDPDGDPGTAWDVPDVCSNSWGVTTGHGYPPCDETFWTVLDGCEAAGVVVVFAAGNEGPGSYSLRRPADRATTDLTSFSVGAVDGNNPNLPIADFSSRGPSNCTPNGNDTFKPEVSAPGVNVRSSIPGGGYQGGWSGTSMATPHVAGVVALMRQANPNLSSEQIRQILLDTAVDHGSPGEDNDYGMGVVNAYDAVLVALSLLQGWGTQGGVITDQATGNPIQGASITVLNRPWHATSRAAGIYFITVPADTAWIIKVEYPPTHLPVFDTITVVENDTIYQDYALEGKVAATLTASFGNPVDADYRSFYFKGSWDSDGFWDNSWSAPLMEVKDDGVAPDQFAADGIFTGRILLARDLAHTYNWAIFAENYGGDNARLQNGAGFQILDLNPPTVPTLSVNPSGSDHNWNISVYGDGGALQLDLIRGYNSVPTKWAAAESLFQGNTYTFDFRAMHSNVVTYGVGGVGGSSIVFDCTFTGPYDFIFDDRNDSYLVQLVGTEGPPTFLSARSGLDGHIPVAWLPPGTQLSQEISYDDGTLVNGYYYFAYDNLMAEMFEPASYPVVIDSVIIHVLTDGDPFWPWPDGTHDPIGISIFLDNGSGSPETDPVFYTEATGEPGEWIRADVDEVLVESGNFWIAVNNLAGDGEEGMGLDAATDYPGNKWARESGVWMLQDYYAGDHMIRAKVFGNDRSAWMGYDSEIAGIINPGTPVAAHPQLTGGTGHANESVSAVKSSSLPRLAYHPKASPVNPPMILDEQVTGYRLYRSTSPNPYSGGVANLVNGPAIPGDLIITTNYDDWCRYNNTDSIQNGVSYYYECGAVYDVGGGAYIEIGPSNQDTAMAQNHAPVNPVNLTGYSVGNDVYLTWNRNTDYDIASYRVFRRDYGQQNFNLVGTVAHPETTFHEVLTLDGIYRYKVAAVDRGDMQSTGFSNSVDVPIGAIPPRNLEATTTLDTTIALRWQHPGGGGGGDLTVLVIASDNANMFMSELASFDDVVQADYFDARTGTPDIDLLSNYNVVVVWSNYVFSDPVGMGNVLADYVDADGGVVLQQFCFGSGWNLAGRIMDEYASFSVAPTSYVTKYLGEFDPAHPIMENVSAISELFSATVSIVNNGELVASYDDGTPLVGVNPDLPVVSVNGYIGDARQFTGDMITMVHNAMNFVTQGAEVIPANYKLYRADSLSGPFNLLVTLPGTDRTYINAPVPNGVDYWYRLTAVYPGPDESDPSNVAHGRAILGARMTCDPLSYNVSGQPGQISMANLNIANPGGLDLSYSIVAVVDQLSRGSVNPHGGATPPRHNDNIVPGDKSNLPEEPRYPPMLLDRGGPDDFGYTWIDSDEPGGPTYNWVDIEGRGQNLSMGDDDNQGPFNLEFDFPFYGNLFNSFRVCSNGWISFTSDLWYYNNYGLPNPDPNTVPPNFVGGFWDDLYPPGGGQIIVYTNADSAVVSWIGVPHFSSGGPYSFQIILTSNGAITCNYMDIGYPDDSNTIGIQNGDGTIGLQVAFNQFYVHNDLALRFTAGWLSSDPASGSVTPGGNTNVDVIMDATFLDVGVYTGNLLVSGSDINHVVGTISIPVTFHVVVDAVDDPADNLPKEFSLSQNYPNPFNPTTEIQFALPVNSHVNIDVFNVLGQKVRTLVDGDMEAGYKSVVWDGTDKAGASVASGTYFYVFKAGEKVFTKKMTMLK